MAGRGRFVSSFLQETKNRGNCPFFFLLLLLTTVTPVTKSTTTFTPAPSPLMLPSPAQVTPPSPIAMAPPSPAPQLHRNQQQINNIIDALIGSGDFNSWADILSVADVADLPFSVTLFVPADESIPTTITIEPFVVLYHIVPQRLSFSELCLLKPLSRLPTLFPSKTVLITNNSLSNFTIDDRLISRPDLYTTHSVAVHGIASLLDYSIYGNGLPTSFPTPKPPSPPSPPGILTLPGIGQLKSNALRFHTEFWVVFLVVLGALLV
ncbi:hypothetical protein HS088_TW21G01426 [Tripterygium wilfordii]|uniref:FAS1 domain-containing protein n=2 Tax=Tripterygium wilfordii TaxID=458696 RepID=A0A7J7C558_TRIWF|nr:hypothetical protein HS088_TW21G01426 [Tripterygium wilfordii]